MSLTALPPSPEWPSVTPQPKSLCLGSHVLEASSASWVDGVGLALSGEGLHPVHVGQPAQLHPWLHSCLSLPLFPPFPRKGSVCVFVNQRDGAL